MTDVKRYKKHGEILGRVLVAAQDGDYVKYADYAALQARVAELEAERDALLGWRTIAESNRAMAQSWQARAESAEALLSEAVKAGMLEGAGLSIQMSEKRESEQTSFIDDTATHEADFGGQIAEAIRGAAYDPETIARIVAQLKEGRG